MIDELKRKKALEELSRNTAQESDPLLEAADQSLGNQEAINVDALLADETPKKGEFVKKTRPSTAMTDVIVGAAPALLGFLTGNYNRTAMGFDEGNTYLQKLAAQDEAAKKNLVKTVDENEYPIYTQARHAEGERVYAPTKAAAKSTGKPQLREFESIDDPNTTVLTFVDPNTGVILDSRNNRPLDLSLFQPKQTYYNKAVRDQFGTQTVETIGRAGKRIGGTELSEGEGKELGIPVPKIRQAEKVSKDYNIRASKYQDDLSNIDMAYSILKDPNSSPQEKKVAIGTVIKTVEQRMTDADRAEYKGEASALVRFGDLIDMTTNNEIPPQTVNAFIQASRNMKNKILSASDKYRSSSIQSYAGSDDKLKSYISDNLKPVSSGFNYEKSAPRPKFKSEGSTQQSPAERFRNAQDYKTAIEAELEKRKKGKK